MSSSLSLNIDCCRFDTTEKLKKLIYALKTLESQDEHNETHLQKLCMSKIQLWRKLHLKCSYFSLYYTDMVCVQFTTSENGAHVE